MIEAQLKWRLRFDSQEAIVDAAVSGMGIGCVPSWLVGRQIAASHLVSLLERSPSASPDTYSVWPAAQHMPMRLRVTIDRLAEKLHGMAEP